MKFPVAVQVYSVRNEAKEDFRGTLEKIKAMGYDGVEFAGLYDHEPAEVKKMCEEIGLVPLSAHVPFIDMLKDPAGVLSQYAEIGCKYVVVPYLESVHRPGTPNYPYVVKFIEILCETAKSFGLQMLYHNHDFEFLKLDGKYALEVLYDSISEDLLKTELDTCWVNIGGEVPADYVRKYTGRAPIVHLKDYAGGKAEDMYELIGIAKKVHRSEGFEFRPLGSGVQDFPAILKAAEDAGAEWVVVEQDRPSMDLTPLESIEKSINYLRSIGY